MSGYLRPFDEVIEERVNAERDRLTAERDAARAELSRLRGVVEAVRALAMKPHVVPMRAIEETVNAAVVWPHEIFAALASVPSSGETGGELRGDCDSCGRQGALRFSGVHGAHFCLSCYARENGAWLVPASPEPTGAEASR